MEQKKLPNVTIALVLGIVSFVACCCSMGIGGILFSGIAFFLVNKDKKILDSSDDPSSYTNAKQLKTARIIAIVGLSLAALALIISIFQIVSAGGWEAYQLRQSEMLEQFGLPTS